MSRVLARKLRHTRILCARRDAQHVSALGPHTRGAHAAHTRHMRMLTSVVCALLLLGLTLARRGAERSEITAAREQAELSIATQRDSNRL